MSDDVLEWVKRELTLPGGQPLELEPWQSAVLERYVAPDGLLPGRVVAGGRRPGGRTRETARAAAAAVIDGHTVTLTAADAASARAMYDAIVDELEGWRNVLDVNTRPLIRRITVQD